MYFFINIITSILMCCDLTRKSRMDFSPEGQKFYKNHIIR